MTRIAELPALSPDDFGNSDLIVVVDIATGVTYKMTKSDFVSSLGVSVISGLTASRVVIATGTSSIGTSSVTTTEIGYLSGVSSAIQTQISARLVIANNLSDLASAATARSNLGLGSAAVESAAAFATASHTHGVTTGGTGVLSMTTGDILYGTAANTMGILAKPVSANTFLTMNTSGALSHAQPDHGNLAGLSDDDHSGAYLSMAPSTTTRNTVTPANATTSTLLSTYSALPSVDILTITVDSTGLFDVRRDCSVLINQYSRSGTIPQPSLLVTHGDHATMTASTEWSAIRFTPGSAVLQWATGALTTERWCKVEAPTLAFAGASTVTRAATMAVIGAPIAGTNATITTAVAQWLSAGHAAGVCLLLSGASGQTGDISRITDDSFTNKIVVDGNFCTKHAAQYYAIRYAASTTINWNNGNSQSLTLANNGNSLTLTNPAAGARYLIELKQPASGAAGTVTWPSEVKWPTGSAPTLTATNGRTDIISLYYNGTNYAAVASLDFAL